MQTRRERLRESTREEIKRLARQQMGAKGTAGLSLRGIAAEMGVTVTALYRYFASLEALITALIADAFDAHADAMEAAVERCTPDDHATQVLALMLAYRDWAVQHPTDFQLIYGNPIPGYVAPREVTVPKAQRGLHLVLEILAPLGATGTLRLPPNADLSQITASVAVFPGFDPVVLYVAITGRLRIHGMVMLEIHGHIEGTITDPDAFYRHECVALLRSAGVDIS
jgi:AcrR family transcriptional regulator